MPSQIETARSITLEKQEHSPSNAVDVTNYMASAKPQLKITCQHKRHIIVVDDKLEPDAISTPNRVP